MNIDENEARLKLLSKTLFTTDLRKEIDYIAIEDYVLSILGIEKGELGDLNPELCYKNYVYLMCHVTKDIKEIEERLTDYKSKYISLQNIKTNAAEFERRKLVYFCDLNKEALEEICSFIAKSIPKFLRDSNYDLLNRECERDGLPDFFFCGRYKYAWHRDYYSFDYPYGISVKLSQYVKEKYKLIQTLQEEQRLLKLHLQQPEAFWTLMKQYVNTDNVMTTILERVSNNYHLKKRQEIFETLNDLFIQKKYQTFITLGLIQVEGLFDDYCQIKFGEKENMGTLIEKAKRTLSTNEYTFLKMYPYFAFDIPLLRNEVAHKGMLQTESAELMAYDLVLDLNTLSQMVMSESYDKFIPAIMAHEKLVKWSPDDNGTDELYDTLVGELLMLDKIANEHFWEIIRNPKKYEDEILFYKRDDLPEGYIDLPGIVDVLARLVRSEGLWKAMHRLVAKYLTPSSKWEEVHSFAKRMKDQYIGLLEDTAKSECIEIAKIVR